MSKLLEFKEKMESAGANTPAVNCFLRAYELLNSGVSFDLPEETIEPANGIPLMEDLPEFSDPEELSRLLSQTAMIKLNGGLGTGMGLQKAKSLLEVKAGQTFLDLIIQQISSFRERTGSDLSFLLMNSFSTSQDTLEFLAEHHPDDAKEVEMRQNFNPKVLVSDLSPANWQENPDLEWCPPGHGDLYTALNGSGWLERLLAKGVKYVFVSNSDNLGASIDPTLLHYFAANEFPFLMEVTKRTPADKKGGHLAARKEDGQLLLREIAQCPDEDLEAFQDIEKHQYFNTNNLWLRLDVLKSLIEENNGFLPLPIITNKKTLDPRDSGSPAVYQLETAMGAAIECFKGAGAVCVKRSRFAPVKTTSDLLSLRSDAYQLEADDRISLIESRNGIPPIVKLSGHYKFVDQLSTLGQPSLKNAKSLEVIGAVRFEDEVVIKGDVIIENQSDELLVIQPGVYADTEIRQ